MKGLQMYKTGLGFCLLTLLVALAQGGEELRISIDGLRLEESSEREQAYNTIRAARTELGKSMIDTLKMLFQKSDPPFNGPLHYHIMVCADWRLEESIDLLLDHVDFQLSKATMPVGMKGSPTDRFPCVDAIARIGCGNKLDVLFQRISKEGNPTRAKLLIYLLWQENSKEILEKEFVSRANASLDDENRVRLLASFVLLRGVKFPIQLIER